MIHPVLCYLGIALFLCPVAHSVYIGTLDDRKFFYLPIVLLIAFYTVHAVATDRQTYQKKELQAVRSDSHGKVFSLGLHSLGDHRAVSFPSRLSSHDNEYAAILEHFFYVFAVCGWPYFFLADKLPVLPDPM